MKNIRLALCCLAVTLLVSSYFVATQPITPRLALVSSFSVLVFALPSYLAVIKSRGRRQGLILLGVLGLYALFIESLAIKTGFPYGKFIYENVLGNKVFGLTPWTVAFAYPPILLLAYWLANQVVRKKTFFMLGATALTATLIDVVLDPAAVRLGFWHWDTPGFFYGVPLVNFLGWLLTGFVGASILHYLWGQKHKTTQALAYSGLAILWFWTGVNLWLGQWIPSLMGLLLSVVIVRIMKYNPVQ